MEKTHHVSVGKEQYMTKKYAQSLSNTKVIYARDEDPEDTMIVRNFYSKIKEHQKVFGVKGIDAIRNIFIQMLALMNVVGVKKVVKYDKYIKKEIGNQLQELIVEFESEIAALPKIKINPDDETYVTELKQQGGYINIKMCFETDFPYLSICNENDNKEFITCIYLFMGEVINLLKYMNTRFNFSATNNLKWRKESQLLNFDNFF